MNDSLNLTHFDRAFIAGMCQKNRQLLISPGPTELAFKIGSRAGNQRKQINKEIREERENLTKRFKKGNNQQDDDDDESNRNSA